jgi:hypothetical protein
MRSTGLLGAAVANNASWCDAVCRSHGYPGAFSSQLWSSPRHHLRLYPNAITLRPGVTAPEALATAEPSRSFAVKDSFARLDLAPAGFGLPGEATWIVRDGEPDGLPDDSLSWDEITGPGELGNWETAWAGGSGDGPVFLPGLLSDPRCAILACRREDAIIAGAIVYGAGGVAGISNVFSAGLAPDRLWADVQQAVAGLHPHLPVVGYEQGSSLEAAQQAGFRVLGKLRIWTRPYSAPLPAPASYRSAWRRHGARARRRHLSRQGRGIQASRAVPSHASCRTRPAKRRVPETPKHLAFSLIMPIAGERRMKQGEQLRA